MRKPHALLLSVLLPFLLAPFVLLAPAASRAQAADNGSWSVYPSATQLSARPYFILSGDPGTTLRDKVTVTNRTGAPLAFRLYAADAYNTVRDGGFAVRTVKERQREVGAWARPARSRVTVPAHGSVTVPFTLRVPERAEPGDHAGALVALDERIDPGSGTVAMSVQRAVGARIYLRVGGPTVPALAVENVRLSHHQPLVPGTGSSTATVSYTLHNTGNVTLDPRVRLKAEGLFGRTLLSRDLTRIPAELLPGQRVRLSEPWRSAPQLDWGDVTLTASAPGTRESASTSFLALPWLVLALVVAALGGAVAVIRARGGRPWARGPWWPLRGRRGRARPSVPAPPSAPAPSTPFRRRSSPSARP